jgi:Ran GTPase-activating protein (RanGAP) involved in mRNA processing and transport
LIAVNLGNLQRLDIRGNKLKDSSVIIMARALKNLSELFVCDNDLSDQSMAEIVTSLKVLTLIWLQNNRVTYKGAEMIIGHEKVKAIGLLGNIISHEEASTLRNRYTFGYLSI